MHSVRRQIVSVNADQQANGQVDDLEMWIRREPEWARGRLVSILFGAFAVLALVLAAVGLYSVVSYSVVQRTNEFGIRMALGAQKKDVLWNVLSSAGVSVGSGLLLGLALSLGLNRLISRWVENGAHDPWLILGASCCASCRCWTGLPGSVVESILGRSHDGIAVRVGQRDAVKITITS